ncbi:MAG: YdcF family protein [Elusimicrobia bacterium]|nr:YdcF family protein [Elusimicrobiota bacterium]
MKTTAGGKILKLLFYGFLLFAAAVLCANILVAYKTTDLTFDDVAKIKPNKTGLLLGTSHFLKGGGTNPFFYNRIEAAVELYNAGKIANIIVSGDNRTRFYNEPEEMRKELLKQGIPQDRIYLDYAGRRTLDSVVRCGEVFGQNSFTVISQKFHNQRAVFLGRLSGFDVVGYNAKGVNYFWGFKTRFREYFARVVMFTDLFFGKKPRFLGEKIDIK